MPIKYLGSKRTLLSEILSAVHQAGGPQATVLDLFSGTGRVGVALKTAGHQVLSNDYTAYGLAIARCYVEADRQDHHEDAERLVREFNAIPGEEGYFTETFCRRSRFFQPKNGARVDAIREAIERKCLPEPLRSILLVSLMEAADRVDSTTGVQMAYLKQWAKRSHNDLELRVPVLTYGKGSKAYHSDATCVGDGPLASAEYDVAYLDPPYNQHSYLGNYHIWESLVTWDKPEVYGVACKRVDVRDRKSDFNSKVRALGAMRKTLSGLNCKAVVVSFNNEGFIPRETMEGLLLERWPSTKVYGHDYKRYIGAQIGIHSTDGSKVGEVSHVRNTEYLYVSCMEH